MKFFHVWGSMLRIDSQKQNDWIKICKKFLKFLITVSKLLYQSGTLRVSTAAPVLLHPWEVRLFFFFSSLTHFYVVLVCICLVASEFDILHMVFSFCMLSHCLFLTHFILCLKLIYVSSWYNKYIQVFMLYLQQFFLKS